MKLSVGILLILSIYSESLLSQCSYSQYKTFSDSILFKNDQIICPNITYVQPGSYRLSLDKSQTALNMIADFILKYPHLKFELGIYSDLRGSSEFNLMSSSRRAEVIKDYLVTTFPINSDQLITKGYGETELIYKEKDFLDSLTVEEMEAMHYCNRRTILKVLRE